MCHLPIDPNRVSLFGPNKGSGLFIIESEFPVWTNQGVDQSGDHTWEEDVKSTDILISYATMNKKNAHPPMCHPRLVQTGIHCLVQTGDPEGHRSFFYLNASKARRANLKFICQY